MAHWTEGMTWLNPPPEVMRAGSDLVVTTGFETDFWRGTFYDFVHDTGHALLRPTHGDFTAETTFSGDYQALYDQAGLMLYASPTHWIKAGIEFTDGLAHLSVVVTNGQSDWSVRPMPGLAGPLTLRLSRHGDAVRVQFRDDTGWPLLRLAWFPPDLAVSVGPMACSPTRAGFRATFHHFALLPPIARDLHESG